MRREITRAQRDAVSRYEAKVYDKTLVRLPKGRLDAVRAAAAAAGLSLNQYIVQAIERAITAQADEITEGESRYTSEE